MKLKLGLVLGLVLTACQNTGSSVEKVNLPVGSESSNETSNPPAASSPTPVPVDDGKVALVFSGSGVCTDGCAQAGADAAKLAGFTPKYVTGNELSSKSTSAEIAAFFSGVKVWIMPGGYARNELNAMSATMRNALKDFVQNGGGYIGWCAGAFAATGLVGTTGAPGLGIIDGNSAVYSTSSRQNSYGGSIEKTTWLNDIRYLYLEGGPYFYDLPSNVEVVGRYDDNRSASAIRSAYGSGRVFLAGTHPEAPTWWWSGTGISDSDGSDLEYAAQMIRWVTKLDP
jgi:glutamine amidotransferase-like uncharacterized protein